MMTEAVIVSFLEVVLKSGRIQARRAGFVTFSWRRRPISVAIAPKSAVAMLPSPVTSSLVSHRNDR